MAGRKIIHIDRDLCDGCGLCTTACDEAALELDDEGKAVLVRDIYCDGMGVCLNVCPTGALTIIEREGEAYDVEATRAHVRRTRGEEAVAAVYSGEAEAEAAPSARSELNQWPVQLRLISPLAPYFEGADLLIAADCTGFALGSFHADLLKGRRLVIACPKLDDTTGYVEKLAELFRRNDIRSVTVAVMTVPCCTGMVRMVQEAVDLAGVDIPVKTVVIGPDGEMVIREPDLGECCRGCGGTQ
ncbi:MAG: 4Fe-4S dicluster domain-containing protein [Actinobacteria bacterium]|nr:4Fe-4S dicluster domain-containing protein [Actinomycetota bacterium]